MRTGATTRGRGPRRGGFTLVELLVVIFIILIVSAAALPVVLPALNARQASEAARLLQGAIVGAQDAAVHANAPRGIRLMPDPAFPIERYPDTDPNNPGGIRVDKILASNRIIPLEAAPDYSEGRLTPYRFMADKANAGLVPLRGGGSKTITMGTVTAVVPAALVVEEALYDTNGFRNNPTSWYWNVRVGDKIRIGKSGWLYTITGPMVIGPAQGNPEMFVNAGVPGANFGPPGTDSPLDHGMEQLALANMPPTIFLPDPSENDWGRREFLYLVNGHDDDGDGFIDNGFDGIDNNLNGAIDENAEWETERWVGGVASAIEAEGFPRSLPYTIIRRPVPSSSARETLLPSDMVVDLTTWAEGSPERSRLPVDRYTGYVDIMFSPRGEVIPTTIYSTPASSGMTDAFYHFWLAERQDLYEPSGSSVPYLPITQGITSPSGLDAVLKGEQRILTLFTRTGQTLTNSSATFVVPGTNNYDGPNRPFISAQQGARGGP